MKKQAWIVEFHSASGKGRIRVMAGSPFGAAKIAKCRANETIVVHSVKLVKES